MTAIADRYRALAHRFTAVVDAVPPEKWTAQSPCEEWTARDVFQHVVDTEAQHLERMGFALPEPIEGRAVEESWPIVRDRVQQALDDPAEADHEFDGYFGRTTFAESADTFYSGDLLVHAWDIARAAGLQQYEAMPDAEVDKAHADMGKLGDSLRMPGVFGPEVEVSEDADRQTRFLAFIGRRA